MVTTLTPKQEAFCQAIVSGISQADAYRKAYDAKSMKPAVVQNKASLLMKKGEVRVRIENLRRPVIEKLQYGLEQAMAEAAEAFAVSKAKEQGGAMVAAVQLRAKLNGLLVDRSEVRTGPLDGLTHEELREFHDAIESVRAVSATGAHIGSGETGQIRH